MRGSLPRSLLDALARAQPPLPRCSAGCWQEFTLRTKETLHEGLCHSFSQHLHSCYGHKGKSLKPPQLCTSLSHGSRATTEPIGNPPDGSSPQHKPASPQRPQQDESRLSLLSGCHAAGQQGTLLPTAAEGQPLLHAWSTYCKPSSLPSTTAPHGAKPEQSGTRSTSSTNLLPTPTMQSLSQCSAS